MKLDFEFQYWLVKLRIEILNKPYDFVSQYNIVCFIDLIIVIDPSLKIIRL